jgi:hypothetical protein
MGAHRLTSSRKIVRDAWQCDHNLPPGRVAGNRRTRDGDRQPARRGDPPDQSDGLAPQNGERSRATLVNQSYFDNRKHVDAELELQAVPGATPQALLGHRRTARAHRFRDRPTDSSRASGLKAKSHEPGAAHSYGLLPRDSAPRTMNVEHGPAPRNGYRNHRRARLCVRTISRRRTWRNTGCDFRLGHIRSRTAVAR